MDLGDRTVDIVYLGGGLVIFGILATYAKLLTKI